MQRAGAKPRVLVLGGGFGGAYAAQRLSRRLPNDWDLTLIDRNNFLLFYPLLVEAGVGSLEARHVVVPIRKFLKRGRFVMAEVRSVDLPSQSAVIQVIGSTETTRLHYDQLIIATGSTTKLPDIPGLKEYAFQFKNLADGIDLRDRGIRLLELANTISDPKARKAILRVVVVGANFTGTEFAGEYQDFLINASKAYKQVNREDISVVVLEKGERILTALEPELAEYAHRHLVKRGLDIRTKMSLSEVGEHDVVLTDGSCLETYTTVWCAGVAPSPLFSQISGLPVNKHGYIDCGKDMRIAGYENVWAVGDGATILDDSGQPYAQTAQNATRQGVLCANNVLKTIEGEPTEPFRFNSLGSLAALGCRTAVAKVFGFKLAGFPAWFLYRTVYLFKMPSWSRRVRIMMDWTSDLFVRAEPVQLGIRMIVRTQNEAKTRQDNVALR
ncbi:MAG TPA: NAD(P)/FAD-dependent oxidoreductase [Fimbriimonadaceae bacterium]|nr:NAD(P)/FAD-dependent oxidoreductase [Fimbriimonadaceae bacterium]